MNNKYVFYFVLLNMETISVAVIKFTNIKCEAFDPPFATFTKCILKLVKRGVVSMSLHVQLHQVPVRNVSVSVALYKKASGYRPFLYNVSTDFCYFLKNTKKIPQLKIVLDALSKDSNINHTCPYNHDIVVNNLVLQESMFKIIPLPEGDYMLKIMVAAYNDWKADVRVFISFNTPAV